MSDQLFNLRSAKQIESYLKDPSHALGIIGPTGAGKGSAASYIAAKLFGMEENQVANHPYFRLLEPQKGVISIESARELSGFLKLKTTGNDSVRRVVVIEDAHLMTAEAQNAVLKLIEEPPADTAILLTLTSSNAVLPTISSRLQLLVLYPIEKQKLIDHFVACGYDKSKVTTYYLMSGGMPGLLHSLLESNNDHPLVHAIDTAKSILKADTFERLTMIDAIAKDKQAPELLQALGYISQAALEQSAASNSDTSLKRWGKILASTHESQEMLKSNAQAKLVLTNLFLSI